MDRSESAEKRICRNCVMPEVPPQIVFNEAGLCNLCVTHIQEKPQEDAKLLESDLVKLLKKHQGKGKYDVLCMCSGGKDSTSALYYMKKRYNLNPLAFTFDNGFETEEALSNVHRAVEHLGVDFLFFRSAFMKDLFSQVLKSNSKAVICHPCSLWYMDLAFDVAARYEIPILVAGWTKGQSTSQKVMTKCGCNSASPEFKEMSENTKVFIDDFVKQNPKYKNFPTTMEEVLKRAQAKQKTLVVSPHWFLPFDQDTYVATIQKELGWQYPKVSYPGRSTNCALNFISVYNSLKHYGYTHYHVEMSKLIRQGLLTREDALRDLEFLMSQEGLNQIAKKLDYRYD